MKKPTTIILLAGVALACVAARQVESNRQNHYPDQADNFGFGLKIAGAWIGEYVVYLPNPTTPSETIEMGPILALVTQNADGTLLAVSPELHGNGAPGYFGLRTPMHGSWKRTGPSSIAFCGVYLATDADGMPGVPALGGGAFLKLNGTSEFARDFQSLRGGGTVRVYRTDQDPLDPDEPPVASFELNHEYRRINTE
jgi:hypothetical protein